VIRFGVMATVAVLETEALVLAVGKLQDLPASGPTRAVGVHIMYAMRCHLRCLTASVVNVIRSFVNGKPGAVTRQDARHCWTQYGLNTGCERCRSR